MNRKGALRAPELRYPERELLSVPAALRAGPAAAAGRPASLTGQQAHDELLDLADVAGKRILATRLHRTVTVREEASAAALEAMSRFAANPEWLVYLPPTMSPSETSTLPGLLEHPAEAIAYYRDRGVGRVVCEEKHMGSRAVVAVCRDEAAARRRFGVVGEGIGIRYSTGRRFFTDGGFEAELLARLRDAAGAAGLWDELATDWALLDGEILPWSAKAQALVRETYAAAGAASRAALADRYASGPRWRRATSPAADAGRKGVLPTARVCGASRTGPASRRPSRSPSCGGRPARPRGRGSPRRAAAGRGRRARRARGRSRPSSAA
jgi:protein phosphatase